MKLKGYYIVWEKQCAPVSYNQNSIYVFEFNMKGLNLYDIQQMEYGFKVHVSQH